MATNIFTDTILRVQNELRVFEKETFTEKEMRGLTEQEKEFIRENDYKKYWDGDETRFYMWIQKNPLGKKQLFAFAKWQIIDPNGAGLYGKLNYRYWHILTTDGFKEYTYLATPWGNPNIKMYFIK